jgi:hypothetical protein
MASIKELVKERGIPGDGVNERALDKTGAASRSIG